MDSLRDSILTKLANVVSEDLLRNSILEKLANVISRQRPLRVHIARRIAKEGDRLAPAATQLRTGRLDLRQGRAPGLRRRSFRQRSPFHYLQDE